LGRSGGFRVFRIDVNSSERRKLRELYTNVMLTLTMQGIQNNNMRKTLLLYEEEMKKMLESIYATTRKRKMKLPPIILATRFTMPNGIRKGKTDAPCVVDLKREELRIPSYNISIGLRKTLVKTLIEENLLEPRPNFTLQVTGRGFVRIIAQRKLYPPALDEKLRLICIDENSSYGFVTAIFDYDGKKWRLTWFEIFKPENQTYRENVAALLRSYADKPSSFSLDKLNKIINLPITTERAYELARRTLHKKRKMNDLFIRRVIGDLRKIIREAHGRNMHVVILIDPINPNSIKNTALQRTLLRTRKFIRNLAYYEGAEVKLIRSSGKQCPICGNWGVEIAPRTYQCPSCGITWNRDRGAVARLPIFYFLKLYESYREKCDDHSALPLLLLHKYIGFLKRHAKFLSPFPSGAGEP